MQDRLRQGNRILPDGLVVVIEGGIVPRLNRNPFVCRDALFFREVLCLKRQHPMFHVPLVFGKGRGIPLHPVVGARSRKRQECVPSVVVEAKLQAKAVGKHRILDAVPWETQNKETADSNAGILQGPDCLPHVLQVFALSHLVKDLWHQTFNSQGDFDTAGLSHFRGEF